MADATNPAADDDLAARVTQAHQALAARDPRTALALARAALAAAKEHAPAADMASAYALNRLGMFFFHQSLNEEAEQAYRPALALLERIAPDDALNLAQLHNNLGQALAARDEHDDAIAHLQQALALGERAGAAADERATYADNLGLALTVAGRPREALPLHERALTTFEASSGPISADAATTLGNLGSAWARLGQKAQARACYLRSLDMHLAVGGLDEQGALVSTANLLSQTLSDGDVAFAFDLCDVLLALVERDGAAADHSAALTLLQAAEHAFDAFQLGLADRLCAAARVLFERVEGGSGQLAQRADRLAARVALAQGHSAEAEKLQLGLIERSAGDVRAQANDWVGLAKNLRGRSAQGAGEAVGLLERALVTLESDAQAEPGEVAHVLLNLAESLFEAERLDEADARYTQALSVLGAKGARDTRAMVLHGHGLLAFNQGRHAAAIERLHQALGLWQRLRGGHHPFVATALSNLALVHWDAGAPALAARTFERARRLRSALQWRNLAAGGDAERMRTARDGLGDLYRAVSLQQASGEAALVAARLMVQHKGAVQLVSARLQARLRERLAPAEQLMLERLAELQRRITALLSAEQLQGGHVDARALAPLQREAAQLQRTLGHRGAYGLAAAVPPDLADIRAALPAGTVLVDLLRYARYEPRRRAPVGFRYAALLLRGRGAPRWIDLGEAAAIDAAAQALRDALRGESMDALLKAERAVGARLIDPLVEAVGRARRWIIAPDGNLNLLPFATLLEPRISIDASVHQIAGASELLRPPAEDAGLGPPVAFVDPDFGDAVAPAAALFDALPATRSEGEVLQRLWPDARVYSGADARADTLAALARPALLHLATHGHFVAPVAEQPLMSTRMLNTDDGLLLVQSAQRSARDDAMHQGGLALAGANGSQGGESGGIVSAAELAQLDLRETALVVLSTCDSGVGRAAPGEEFAGLRRAFAIAGARSQITSLWAADDDATAALMEHLYAELRAGRPRAAALRSAQHAVRARPSWSHPFHWAGFVLWGDDGALPPSLVNVRAAAA